MMTMLMPTRRNFFNDLMADPFDAFFNAPFTPAPKSSSTLMRTDIKEHDDGFEMTIDLPGFKKEDIHVDVKDNTLSITAERHSEFEQKDKKNSYLRCERSFGSYSRSFDVSGIDCANIKAAYKDGVLTLTLPKQKKEEPTGRRLEIE